MMLYILARIDHEVSPEVSPVRAGLHPLFLFLQPLKNRVKGPDRASKQLNPHVVGMHTYWNSQFYLTQCKIK